MSEIKPNGYVIFCDDVRQEVGNKQSLIGVYPSDLVLHEPAFPVTLPKLCVMVSYVQPMSERRNAKLEIYLPGDLSDKPTAVAELPLADVQVSGKTSSGDDATKLSMRMYLVFSPITFKETGKIKVVIRCDDTVLDLGKLNVLHSPRETVTPQPADAKGSN